MHWRFLPQSAMATTFAIQWLSNITILFTLSLYSTIMTSFSWLLVHYLNGLMILALFHELQAITNVFILILELSQIWPVGASSRECLEKQFQLAFALSSKWNPRQDGKCLPLCLSPCMDKTWSRGSKRQSWCQETRQGPSYWTDLTGIDSFL